MTNLANVRILPLLYNVKHIIQGSMITNEQLKISLALFQDMVTGMGQDFGSIIGRNANTNYGRRMRVEI